MGTGDLPPAGVELDLDDHGPDDDDFAAASESESPFHLSVDYDVTGVRAGWSAPLVNRVLEEWVAEHADRSDLRFLFDPELISDWVLEDFNVRDPNSSIDSRQS